eukprot:TRINITY_DN12554_c0_g1_i1.p2 TRINITY_DN12554_c0_g1~~TRINITY_DN12554_c0_g1_i1.p2  ORF type:complete len:147 (-),score=23.02 TRINITY_DN12554_c0_g1_i1:59-499(-)
MCVENYADGSIYEGGMLNGLRHGQGKFSYKSGGRYEGSWVHGKMEGFGTLYYANGQKAYEGEWCEDKFHGQGTMFSDAPQVFHEPFNYEDFDCLGDFWVRYEGCFLNDAKHGNGKIILGNGEVIEGEFRSDKLNGSARYFLSLIHI